MTKRAKTWALIIAAVILCLDASPFLLTLGWHLLHRNAVQYGSKRILVPIRWMPYEPTSMNEIGLMKSPLTLIVDTYPEGMISTSRILPGKNTDAGANLAAWELAFRMANENTGKIVGPMTPEGAPQNLYCMTMYLRIQPKKAVASCLLPGGSRAATFIGYSSDLPHFFYIVKQLA